MEEEISLKEIFITLWQGRYIIIAVTAITILIALAVSLIFTTPKYRATTSFYFEPYLISDFELYLIGDDNRILEQVVRDDYIPLALADLTEDPRSLAEAVSIEHDKGFVEITAAHPDPETAVKIAEQLRAYFRNLAFEQAVLELESEKYSLIFWLEFFDQQFSDHYEDYFTADSFDALVADPGYAVLMEERGRRIAMLHEVNYSIQKYESIEEEIVEDHYFPATVTSEPDNVRWQLNTAVAAVLGLMLSVMIVFVKPFAEEIAAELKSSKNDSE